MGGLGSQLFAVALLKDIQKGSPKRRIAIILHTGGVTRRLPEVVDLFPEISFNYMDDFSTAKVVGDPGFRNLLTKFSPFLKRLVFLLGIVQSCNYDVSLKRIRF